MDILRSQEDRNMKNKPKIILVDLGKVLLFSKEELSGKMNPRHKELIETAGKNYPFFKYFGVNEKLLKLLTGLKDKYLIYMITEGDIQNHSPLKERLEKALDYNHIFSTSSLNLDKKKPEAYEYVVQELGVEPSEILFIDDSSDNITAASQVGFQVIQSLSESQVVSDLKESLDLN